MKFLKKLICKSFHPTPRAQIGSGPIVRAICITSVKNEQDVIEPFLRHNHRFFDAMFILENGSSDRTREIAVSCARELDGIFVTDLASFDNEQSKNVTAAFKYIQTAFFADHVCFLDADEFIGADDRNQFLRALSDVPVGTCSQHFWQTFLPDPDAPFGPSIDPLSRLTFRRCAENPDTSKVMLRMGGGFVPDLIVRRGLHSIGASCKKTLPGRQLPNLPIRHFPVRNPAQVLSKAVLGWMGNLAIDPTLATTPTTPRTMSFQWKRLYHIAQTVDADLTAAQLSDEAMVYAQNVQPACFADNAMRADNHLNLNRAYSDGQSADYYRTVAASVIRSGRRPPVFTVTPPQNQSLTKSDVSTAFDSDWHWRHVFFDAAPFRDFMDRHCPASVFDIGCGKGLYLRFLSNLGVKDVFGVDGVDQSATVLSETEDTKADLHLPFDAGRRFDAVFCLEVAEHLRPEATDTLFDTIAAHAAKTIVFSMAEPGQPGHRHINCQTLPFVLDMWRKRGWVPDLVETLGFRALSTLSWFRRNVVILKPATSQDDGAIAALCQIADLKYNWYDQKAGIRSYAFDEAYPTGKAGYGKVIV